MRSGTRQISSIPVCCAAQITIGASNPRPNENSVIDTVFNFVKDGILDSELKAKLTFLELFHLCHFSGSLGTALYCVSFLEGKMCLIRGGKKFTSLLEIGMITSCNEHATSHRHPRKGAPVRLHQPIPNLLKRFEDSIYARDASTSLLVDAPKQNKRELSKRRS